MIESSDAYREAIVADGRRMHVRAVVNIVDPDMEQGDVTSAEQEPGISRPEQLWNKNFALSAHYASLEPNRWILDGSYMLRPPDAAARDWEAGLVGAALSGEDGVFPVPQWAQIEFSNVSILQACAVAFSDRLEDGVAADFTVEVLSEGVAYHTKEVTGNASPHVSVTGFRVNNPDAIRVTVTRWSLPGRRMRIAELVPGVYEIWRDDELSEFAVKHQGDPTCLTLPYGTARIAMDNQSRRFDPRTKDGVFLMIEERQGIELGMGPELPDGTTDYKPLGTFYQHNGGWKTGDNSVTMKWDLVDIVGLLAGRAFVAPKELPTTLRGWLEALTGQLGKNFGRRVRVDPEYADLPIPAPAGSLRDKTCGDILLHVCQSAGVWPRADASTGFLAAEPLRDEGNRLTLDNLNKYPVMSANQDAASITVNGYTIEGTAPSCGNTVEVDNPFVPDEKRMERARALLAFYGGDRLETVGRGDPSGEIGDTDVIWLAQGSAVSARRVRQEFRFSNRVLKNCASAFIRGDGLSLFTNRVQFLESGAFTVPEGIYRLWVVLVGHGGHGAPGSDGRWVNTNQWMGSNTGVRVPVDGAPGMGGKVWAGAIDVNPGQVIQIVVQPVRGATTLWNYSSAMGKSYPNGFTDVATGEVYGRQGGSGKPGSGDGGTGGLGGEDGTWYNRGVWVYDDGHVAPPGSGNPFVPEGVDPDYDGPGHWEHETVIEKEPTNGQQGTAGATGCAILYWEEPEVIDDDGA